MLSVEFVRQTPTDISQAKKQPCIVTAFHVCSFVLLHTKLPELVGRIGRKKKKTYSIRGRNLLLDQNTQFGEGAYCLTRAALVARFEVFN